MDLQNNHRDNNMKEFKSSTAGTKHSVGIHLMASTQIYIPCALITNPIIKPTRKKNT